MAKKWQIKMKQNGDKIKKYGDQNGDENGDKKAIKMAIKWQTKWP